MFKENKDLRQALLELVHEEINKIKTFGVYVVTDTNIENYTVNIIHTTNSTLQYAGVAVCGIGLGNYKGIMALPQPNDYVIVGFVGEKTPVVLGTIFSIGEKTPVVSGQQTSRYDIVPAIKDNELLIASRTRGSYVFFDENGYVKIKSGTDVITIKNGTININSGTINITGGTVNINNGTQGIARDGDAVSVTVPSHGTCTGTITAGSASAKCG
jgi:hypothetical protein